MYFSFKNVLHLQFISFVWPLFASALRALTDDDFLSRVVLRQ
jgi:hypothetical protein